MLEINRATKNNRLMKGLTGLSIKEFEILSLNFSRILYESKIRKDRKRAIGAGPIGKLIDDASKLFFILFYLKIYPTCDLGGFVFGVDRSRICRWANQFMPILEKALGRSVRLPKRQISSVEELLKYFPEAEDLFIDGTERRTQRPKNPKTNRKRYSGKKKAHTRKNTIICNEKKEILLVSKTKDGKIHDLTQLKKSGLIDYLPPGITLWVDKGYKGITKYLKHNNAVMIPHKKSKKHPLTLQQKSDNAVISGIRAVIEHAIGGIKRFGSMSNIYRNKHGQDDQMIYLCASLWNFHLQYKDC